MPGPNEGTNGHAPKFQLVKKSSYPELHAILKQRLPFSIQLCNSLQMELTGDNSDYKYYVYNGILDANAIVVGNGTMQQTETDAGTMLNVLSAPNPEAVTPEFAFDFVSHFTRSDRNLSYTVERRCSANIFHALMNQGHVIEVRGCKLVALKPDFKQPVIPLPPNCILKSLEPEDASTVVTYWKYGLWDRPVHYAKKCIERNPSAGIYSTETGELMSWATTYNFGSFGMLHTPEKFRGQGLAKIVVQRIIEESLARGIVPCTGVEPRNAVSDKLMTQLGIETVFDCDFFFTS